MTFGQEWPVKTIFLAVKTTSNVRLGAGNFSNVLGEVHIHLASI